MTDTTNNQRVNFGVKTSVLIDAATQLGIIGTASTKAAKVAALAAILQGAPTEDTAKRTRLSESVLKRIAAIARGKQASKISEAMHKIDWTALAASDYDSVLAASHVWDDFLVEESKSKTKAPMSATDLAILVHDSIVAADNPAVWIAAVEDALASAAAKLAESDDSEEEEETA